MAMALLHAGLTLPQLFLVVGLMNAAVAAYIFLLVPEFLMRFLCSCCSHIGVPLQGQRRGEHPGDRARRCSCATT